MKKDLLRILLLTFALLVVAGCSSPATRVARNQAAFDSWPAAVRDQVRAGQVALGFTMEQVGVALGEPDRKFERTSGAGAAEVWVYRTLGPNVSFGLGVGTAGTSAMGGGMGWEDYNYEEAARVVFADGVVSAVERRK